MLSGIALSSAVAFVAFASLANAHGYLEEPSPTWVSSPDPEWVVNIDNFWDIGSGGDQCGLYKTMAAEKDVTVKDVVLEMVGDGNECGYTLADGTAQPIPSDGMAKWLGNGGGGFTHVGPCEIYIDDTMVLHGDNCEDEYPGGDVGSTVTSDMPVDYSSCTEDCVLTIYWLAFQNEQWQAYINCVPLIGSGATTTTTTSTTGSATTTEASGTSSTAAEATTTEASSTDVESTASPSTTETTEAPEATTAAPTATTAAPVATTATPIATTQTPVATTQATEEPTTTTQTPSTEAPATEVDTKCTRRLRK